MRVASSFQGPFPTTDKEAFAASFDMPINQCAKLWKNFQITYFFSKSFRQKAFFYHFSKLKPLLGIFLSRKNVLVFLGIPESLGKLANLEIQKSQPCLFPKGEEAVEP